jgi:site-specific DNA-methyltransferase (adenine-specific)
MTYQILHGNNLDILPTLADNSIDSIVTDPPYELGFMGKKWDSSGIAYSVELWQQCLRVLKPGGHLLSFGGTRTYHRVAVAIEDAGFELRDSIAWLYGSGFPKSLDVSKAIDKAAGAEREIIGTTNQAVGVFAHSGSGTPQDHKGYAEQHNITAPATLEAQQWQGWGTALKPAFEPVIVARKPIEGTVANNVLKWGTGGLNIDGSRIGTTDKLSGGGSNGKVSANGGWDRPWRTDPKAVNNFAERRKENTEKAEALGRWPANIILDPYTAELLDEQSGTSTSPAKSYSGGAFGSETTYAQDETTKNMTRSARPAHGDSGGASRFFYVAKASKRDRNEGLEDLPEVRGGTERMNNSDGRKAQLKETDRLPTSQNFHPTVKPTSLMKYLIKLVTPSNGTVLDPFTGSGSTGKAAILQGFDFIGVEMTEEYLPIIEGRLKHAEAIVAERIKETSDKQSEVLF